MMNLFDTMQAAQNGQAMQNLARQYGLSQQQTQSAVEALLPAFTMGLQRQTRDPYTFGNLAGMMTATPFGRMYDSDGDGIPDKAVPMGKDVLAQLFGSKEVSNAVAAQAAATSGVGQAILKQMLPVIASMVMAGLFKNAQSGGLGGIFGQFAEMMRGAGGGMPAGRAAPEAAGSPFDAILGQMFGQGAAPGAAPTGRQAPSPFPTGQNPGADMLGSILSGMFGGARAQAAPESAPVAPPLDKQAAGPGPIGLDALNQMFEHGRAAQDQHQNAMKSIFDAMLGGQAGPERRR